MSRPRLLRVLTAHHIVVLEAGGGCGKSVLGAEYGRSLGIAVAAARLGPGEGSSTAIVQSLARGLRAARLTDLSRPLAASDREPSGLIEALLEALARTDEPVLLIVDDAHHVVDPDAGELVRLLATALPAPHRIVVACRRLAPPLNRLAHAPDAVVLGAAELAFTDDETGALLAGAGVQLPAATVTALRRATDGWAAALAMAAAMIARTDDHAAAAARLLAQRTAAPTAVLDELLVALSSDDQRGLIQLAHLPLLSAAVADAVIGSDAALHRIMRAGVPLAQTPDGWLALPGPVEDHLRSLCELRPDAAAAAAAVYAEVGEHRAAWEVLLAAGLVNDAAAMLEGLGPSRIEELGCDPVAEVVAALADPAVEAHPGVLLHLARAAEATYRSGLRTQALGRLSTLPGLSAAHRSELEAECCRDLLWEDGRRDQAEAHAAKIAWDSQSSVVARARALDVLGRARCWISPGRDREQAEPLLLEAARLARRVSAHTWAAQALVPLAYGVQFAGCRSEQALATFDQALVDLPPRSRYRALVHSFRADVLIELGRPVEAQASIDEVRLIGNAFSERWASAFAAWSEAKSASYAGDRDATLRAVVEVERHRDGWYERAGGIEFLAQAADLVDRVGEHNLASEYLARARERAAGPHRDVQLYSASVAGRSGDPEQAEQLIGEMLAREDRQLQELWWLELLHAYAAHRAGDARTPQLAAVAFDRCLEFGALAGPIIREHAVATALLPLAAATGSRSAVQLLHESTKLAVTVLGGFGVRRGGRELALPVGMTTTAVQAVAVRGGRVRTEELIELLWPGAPADRLRNRLRNLLSRLHAAAGDVLVRDRAEIALAPGTTIDAATFEAQASNALARHPDEYPPEATARARVALDRYVGELLPDQPYAAWATEPRERLRSQYLELLDLLIAESERREDIDAAVRLLQRAIATEPHDEARYLRLAQLLSTQGRAGSALATLRRARSALAGIGIEPSSRLLATERSITPIAEPDLTS